MIASLHVPHFAVALHRLDNAFPESIPLILTEREQVYAASPEAEAFGVRPRQSEREALARCPVAHVAPAAPLRDAETLARILDLLRLHTPEVEPITSPQAPHFLLNMPVRGQQDMVEIARTLGREVRVVSELSPALAIAPGAFTARLAAAATPPGHVRYIDSGQESRLLAALPLDVLPLAADVRDRLARLGVHTVGAFVAIPLGELLHQFGKGVEAAYHLARGRDATLLRPRLPSPSIEAPFLFDEPLAYLDPLLEILDYLSGYVSGKLHARRVQATALWLLLVTEEGKRQERRRTLREPFRDAAAIYSILEGLLRQLTFESGVTEIRVIASGLTPIGEGARQLAFFDRLAPPTVLQLLLPRLYQRHGGDAFKRVAWRSDRAGWMPEDQFELVPF